MLTLNQASRKLRIPYAVLAACAIVLLGFTVYWPGVHGGFIFDDYPNLVHDDRWKVNSLEPAAWIAATSGISSEMGRPLAMLSFAINHYFTGAAPLPLKVTNLSLHVINGILAFILSRNILLLTWHNATRRESDLAAAVIAISWLVHPIHASTVLYVVQRMEIGAASAVLCALALYLHARQRQISGHQGRYWFIAATASGLVGLGFKETALLLPCYALLFEAALLRFSARTEAQSRTIKIIYIVITGAALLGFTLLIAPKYLTTTAYEFRDFTLESRLWTQIPVLALYAKQIAWPSLSSLTFYYDNFPISTSLTSPPTTALSAAVLIFLLGVAIAGWRNMRAASLGILWFFASHALTSNIIPLELAFEHRNYLATLGPIIAFITISREAFIKAKLSQRSAAALAILAIASLGTLCFFRSMTWGSPLLLATTLAAQNPGSAGANYALGALFLAHAGDDTSSTHWSMARRQFEYAAELPNSSPLSEQALIIMHGRAGRPVDPDLWSRLRMKLNRRAAGPHEIEALHSLLECRISNRCQYSDQQLLETFTTALSMNPNSATLHVMYGKFAWNVLHDPELAIAMQREAVRLAPNNPVYSSGLKMYLDAVEEFALRTTSQKPTSSPRAEVP